MIMATTRWDLRLQRAQQAVDSIGLGFDITQEICFDNFKSGPRLIQINELGDCRDMTIPGGVSIPSVPNSIRCYGGESLRIQSEVLTFHQMLDHFNEGMLLTGDKSGKIASGHFYASFGLSGRGINDVATIKYLAYDGCFIKRYAIELDTCDREPPSHVKAAVPSFYNPEALARFIERFGTHVVLGVSMGGKDVFYIRQEGIHQAEPDSLLKLLKDKASMRFADSAENHCPPFEEDIVLIYNRRGGSKEVMRHSEWLQTIDLEPDIISVFLLPLQTLLRGIPGGQYVVHAINLYARYKPPIEYLHQFLKFQLPKRWAPGLSETSLGSQWKNQVKISGLQLGILGPMLYINTNPVDSGNTPVTGVRLQLEGARSDRLAIHLKHLTSLPMGYQLSDEANSYLSCDPCSCNFHKKVKWCGFSCVCTAPVESNDSVSIVKGAQLLVQRNCLILRLCFSKVVGATLKKSPEWDNNKSSSVVFHRLNNSSSLSSCISGWKCMFPSNNRTMKRLKNHPKPGDVTIGSTASAPQPVPVNSAQLQRFVDTTEMTRGPEDTPGYWVVSGAGLSLLNGEIKLRVKYSLLSFQV